MYCIPQRLCRISCGIFQPLRFSSKALTYNPMSERSKAALDCNPHQCPLLSMQNMFVFRRSWWQKSWLCCCVVPFLVLPFLFVAFPLPWIVDWQFLVVAVELVAFLPLDWTVSFSIMMLRQLQRMMLWKTRHGPRNGFYLEGRKD